MAPLHSLAEPTKFSLQTQTTMPVHPNYDTEATQPHLPARAGGKPSSRTPSTLCAPDNSLGLLSSCVFLEPGFYTPPQGRETFVSFSMTHWDGPTTIRKPLWFGDRKPTGMVLPPAGNPSFVVSPVCVTHGKQTHVAALP